MPLERRERGNFPVSTVERHAVETDVDLIEPHGVRDRIAPTRWGVGGA